MPIGTRFNKSVPCIRTELLAVILVILSPMLGLSCGSVNPQRESLGEMYWQTQQLRYRSGNDPSGAEALRDLGVIYLRTGNYQKAYDALSRSLVQDRSDPKRWLYAGLAQELLGRNDAALTTYRRFLSLASTSRYTRAMRGRAAWLGEASTQSELEEAAREPGVATVSTLDPNRYAVFPIECSSEVPGLEALGAGLGNLFSNDLESLRNVDMVDPDLVRMAYGVAEDAVSRGATSRPVWVGEQLGAGRIIGGSCTVGTDRSIELDLVLRDLVADTAYAVSQRGSVEDLATIEQTLIRDLATQLRIWIPNRPGFAASTLPSFEALVPYSKGVILEDEDAVDAAIAAYEDALGLHPSFILAEVDKSSAENKLLSFVTTRSGLIELVVSLEAAESLPLMLDSRIALLKSNSVSGLDPTLDSRRPPLGNIGELPGPPAPPIRN